MANTWIGSTPNLQLDIYNISTVLSDDISGEQLLASLINSTSSNTTKIDEFAGNASAKPASAVPGNIGQFDNNRNVIDSGKSISGTVGSDDTTVPTGKGVRDFVLQQQVVHTDYQGMFDYFGSQQQVEAATAVAGQTAIIYLGAKTNVTGVQRGEYNGTSWTFADVSPAENNGMWIFALELLDDGGTHFGMAIYKSDGTNPPSFDTAPFPLFKPDMQDIAFDSNGDLTLTDTGAEGTYGEAADKTLDYGNSFKVSQTTVDKKGRVTGVSERAMTLPNAPTIGNATITIKQGDIEKGSFTTNQSTAVTINLDEALQLINTYDTIAELIGEVGDIIEVAVNTIQVPQGGIIILGQTLVVDAGWDGAKSGGTIGRIDSYANSPANTAVNVKILTKTGGGGSGVPIGNVTNLEVELSNQQLTLTWGDPDNIIIDGVVLSVWGGTMLRYKTTPWLPADNETVGTLLVDNISRNAYQTTGFTHTGLINGTAYYYKLFPYNEDGRFTNDIGNQISGTPVGVPAQVTNPQFEILDRAIGLSWTNPTPTDYWVKTVLVRNTGAYPTSPTNGVVEATYETASLNTTTHNSTGLTAGTTYYYRWFTMNSLGQYSTAGIAQVTAAAYQTPSSLTALSIAPNDGANALSWNNPADANRTGIRIVWNTTATPTSPTDGTIINLAATATSYNHTGLTNGTTYYYTLFASNTFSADSTGKTNNFSAGISDTGTPSATPGTPTNFTITRLDGQLTLNWTHSSSSTNVGTRIVYKTGSAPTSPTDGTNIDVTGASGTAGTRDITGLTNGTTYFFALYAYNNVPNYSTATQNNAAPIANVGAVSNFAASPGNAQVSLSWTNPGGTFTSVMIRRNTGAFPASITDGVQVYNGSGNSYLDTGLTNGTQYFYRAFPTNGVNPNTTTTGQQVSATPLALSATFSANTWAQVKTGSDMIEANSWTATQVTANLGWSIGDRKTVDIGGTNYDLKIIGFNHDDKVGGGKAGISLELGVQTGGTQAICFGTATGDRRRMEATNINSNGWNGCEMRSFLNATGSFATTGMLALLPTDLREIIKTVVKPTATSGTNSALINSQDNVFLLSEREVFGNNTYSAAGEGTRYAWYTANDTAAARIKHQPMGTASLWWLRSPGAGGSNVFCGVYSSGNASIYTASNAYGVSFGLCV